MYANLESRVFDSYLKQSPNEFAGCDESVVSKNYWFALYNWTRNTYQLFANNPEFLIKQLHENCDLPGIFGTYSTLENGAKIKAALRKAIAAMNSLLQFVWESTLAGKCNDGSLTLPENYKIPKKYITLLGHTGITVADNSLIANDYAGMFSALKELTKQTDDFVSTWSHHANGNCSAELNGYRRFVRCVYDKSLASWFDIFGDLSGDITAFNKLTRWLKDNNFQEGIWLDTGSFESPGVSFKKNITGENLSNGNIYLYDHDHIGFKSQYSIIRMPAQSFHLTIQNPRDILSSFETLPPILQNFIVKYHAKCNNCGYCTMRSKGKCKPYTIIAKFEGKAYPFCPIHHVYSYHWNSLNDEIVDGLAAYLQYLQNFITSLTTN
jgi:hypothetical protein